MKYVYVLTNNKTQESKMYRHEEDIFDEIYKKNIKKDLPEYYYELQGKKEKEYEAELSKIKNREFDSLYTQISKDVIEKTNDYGISTYEMEYHTVCKDIPRMFVKRLFSNRQVKNNDGCDSYFKGEVDSIMPTAYYRIGMTFCDTSIVKFLSAVPCMNKSFLSLQEAREAYEQEKENIYRHVPFKYVGLASISIISFFPEKYVENDEDDFYISRDNMYYGVLKKAFEGHKKNDPDSYGIFQQTNLKKYYFNLALGSFFVAFGQFKNLIDFPEALKEFPLYQSISLAALAAFNAMTMVGTMLIIINLFRIVNRFRDF